jgi:hypothetical protein
MLLPGVPRNRAPRNADLDEFLLFGRIDGGISFCKLVLDARFVTREAL